MATKQGKKPITNKSVPPDIRLTDLKRDLEDLATQRRVFGEDVRELQKGHCYLRDRVDFLSGVCDGFSPRIQNLESYRDNTLRHCNNHVDRIGALEEQAKRLVAIADELKARRPGPRVEEIERTRALGEVMLELWEKYQDRQEARDEKRERKFAESMDKIAEAVGFEAEARPDLDALDREQLKEHAKRVERVNETASAHWMNEAHALRARLTVMTARADDWQRKAEEHEKTISNLHELLERSQNERSRLEGRIHSALLELEESEDPEAPNA